jgi:hypothetical protein
MMAYFNGIGDQAIANFSRNLEVICGDFAA